VFVACHGKTEHKDFGPRFFSSPGARVQCSKGVDRDHEWKHEALAASLETARDKGVVLHTFGHAPKLDLDEYLPDFDWAAQNGVPLVTFGELAAGHTGAGWAFTVDDDEVDTWYGWRDKLRAHHAKLTFFVTRFDRLTAHQRQELHELAADGHDIEAHSVLHLRGPDYVEERGLGAYLADEVDPSIDGLRAQGFDVQVYAYPFGARTSQTDRAILERVSVLRSVVFTWSEASSPCPL
jgi:hypothetical protein